MRILVSAIIPIRVITPDVRETIAHLNKQGRGKLEIILVTDEDEKYPGVTVISSKNPGPAYKRNLGAKKARGDIFAFLDDDSYPSDGWLKNAISAFDYHPLVEKNQIAAVCGPTLTPPKDTARQIVSGWVSASWFGASGAGVYRNRIMPARLVDDYPSVNLLVRKADFWQVGGFDINNWPGEDTKLCLDLTKLGKKIVYDPGILVFHHRRSVFLPHLKQISRYALRRGYFARKYPDTSFRIGYFIPTFFAYGIIVGPILSFFLPALWLVYCSVLVLYLILLVIAALEVILVQKNLRIALLFLLAVPLTHLVYGILFPLGFIKKQMGVVPHQVDKRKGVYLGG